MIKSFLMRRRSHNSLQNTVNIILNTGQSLSDEAFLGDTVDTMNKLGIKNPAYSENPFPGQPFRNWCNSTGFSNFVNGTETAFSITSIVTDSNFNATITTSAAHGYVVTNKVLISGVDQQEYNGIHKIFGLTANTYRISLNSQPPNATGATMLSKRAGCKEVWQDDISKIVAQGSLVNVKGIMFMQGRGNSNSTGAPETEWNFGRFFVELLKDYIDNTVSAIDNVTIDNDFAISVGLVSSEGAATTAGQKQSKVRDLQIKACRHRDYAYWTESIQFHRGDGVHIVDQKAFHKRQIETILNKDNRRAPSSQFGLT